jgi:phage gp46-like protein
MTDIRLLDIVRPVPVTVTFDWVMLPDGTIDEAYELASAVIVALATDRLARDDDELPGLEPDDDRRGWWADIDAEEIWSGWPIGSRLWLLERGKITDSNYRKGSTLARAEMYTAEALQPFIDNRLCSAIDITASRGLGQNYSRIDVRVKISRGNKTSIALLFDSLWEEQISGAQGSN